MEDRDRRTLRLLSKKYTYEILKSLEKNPKRFGELAPTVKSEKMRAERLRELAKAKFIKARASRIDGRAVSVYSLSSAGRSALRFSDEVKKLRKKS